MHTPLEREWVPFTPCPCEADCGVIAPKLSVRSGHVVGCKCRSCIGKRNKTKGQRNERTRHLALGGEGATPRDELAFSYSVNITTEDKTGQQIPAKFVAFIQSEWTRHALRQAEKKVPVGSDALPALWLNAGHAGTWIVLRVPAKGLR